MTRTASAIAIVLAALALAPASASSAEITGCLTKRGTLTKVAPGPRPAAPCSPQQAKRVSIPVISGGTGPGTARVDTYSFWREIDSDTSDPDGVEVIMRTIRSQSIGFWVSCTQQRDGEGLIAKARLWPAGYYVIRGEGQAIINRDDPIDVALGETGGVSIDVATREVITLVNHESRMTIDLVTDMVTEPNQPTRCTFSGTAELFRAR